MTSYLADVNVWLAATWRGHVHHDLAREWFYSLTDHQLWFCRFSQLGFLRLLTNAKVMGADVKNQAQAWAVYDKLTADRRVGFVAEPLVVESVLRRLTRTKMPANQAWSDAYLAAVAECHRMTIATFDRAFTALQDSAVIVGS